MNEVKDTVYITGFLVWFCTCWYLNTKLDNLSKKIDLLCNAVDRLRPEE